MMCILRHSVFGFSSFTNISRCLVHMPIAIPHKYAGDSLRDFFYSCSVYYIFTIIIANTPRPSSGQWLQSQSPSW